MPRILHNPVSLALALSLVSGPGVIASAYAQVAGGLPGVGGFPGAGSIATGQRAGGAQTKPALPEPDAVPGAKPRGPVAPATKSATDMAPNDALFDAINRGDIAAARDALNRGADLNATNVLGMTPMEASVDLGRNDISFLLLSMRGAGDNGGSNAAAGSGGQPAAQPVKVVKTGANRAARVAPVRVATKPVTAPKLFANDGGAPVPSAGFLGFGTRQAAE